VLNRLQLLGIYNESVFIFSLRALRAERDIAKYESEIFIKKKIKKRHRRCRSYGVNPFRIFGARDKRGASNAWSYHIWSASVASAATILYILHILHNLCRDYKLELLMLLLLLLQ